MTRSQKNIVDFFNDQQKHNKVVLEVTRIANFFDTVVCALSQYYPLAD
ncbi:hypothetical protein ACS126_13165 [Sphingobacterium lactis]